MFWSLLGIWFFALINPNEATAATNEPKPNVNKAVIEVIPIEEEDMAAKGKSHGFQIVDPEGKTIYSDSEGFVIRKNSPQVDAAALRDDYKDFVLQRFEADPYLRLNVTGSYSAQENIEQPNYGLQRAGQIRDRLVEAGVAKGRITLKASIGSFNFDNGTYNKGVQFQFYTAQEEWVDTDEPLTLIWRPQLNYNQVIENKALRQIYKDLESRLKAAPDTKVVVVGHTDQVGSARDNYQTGLDCARQVRDLLMQHTSLSWWNISSESKGEQEPVNTSGTVEAGKENKRIEIIIK